MKTLFGEYDFDRILQWRLAVAALLPVAILTFVVVGHLPDTLPWLPTADQWLVQLLLGALVAPGTLEASRRVSGTRQAMSFMLFLSTFGTGLLYVVMEGALARFQPAVFATVLAGGLHFIFRDTDSLDDEPQELPVPVVDRSEESRQRDAERVFDERQRESREVRSQFAALRRIEERYSKEEVG